MLGGVKAGSVAASPAIRVAIASKSCRYACRVCGEGLRVARSVEECAKPVGALGIGGGPAWWSAAGRLHNSCIISVMHELASFSLVRNACFF